MKSKIAIIFIVFMTISLISYGQVRFEPFESYTVYSIGAGAGYATIYGPLEKSYQQPAFLLHVARHYSSSLVFDLELQSGSLKSTEPANKWTTGLSETSNFTALNVTGRIALKQLIKNPHNTFFMILSNLYAGTGLGIVNNNIVNITNKFKTTDTKTINSDIILNGVSAMLPVNLGINFSLRKLPGLKRAQLNINYQQNYTSNDNVSGYSFPKATTEHKHNTVYSVLSAGISIYLGHINEYNIEDYE